MKLYVFDFTKGTIETPPSMWVKGWNGEEIFIVDTNCSRIVKRQSLFLFLVSFYAPKFWN